VKDFRTSQRKTPENNWRGLNGGYGSPDYDALVDRYLVTVPTTQRVELLGQVLRHLSDQVVVIVLFWDVEPILLGKRVANVTARHRNSSHGWNSALWDVVP
jgi:ABC-type transport system substrate-binding protein